VLSYASLGAPKSAGYGAIPALPVPIKPFRFCLLMVFSYGNPCVNSDIWLFFNQSIIALSEAYSGTTKEFSAGNECYLVRGNRISGSALAAGAWSFPN